MVSTFYTSVVLSIILNPYLATSGQVVNVFFAILIGSFSLALLAPEMQGKQFGSIHAIRV
jgi:hypothetical protein